MKKMNLTQMRPLTFWEKLQESIIPHRCVLCNKWKLLGWRPHKECSDEEAARIIE